MVIRYEIAQAVIQHRGDGRIAQPNFEWGRGLLHVRANNPNLELTWRMLSEAIHGLRAWGWDVAWIAAEFTILDQKLGPVGSGSIETGYYAVANSTATA